MIRKNAYSHICVGLVFSFGEKFGEQCHESLVQEFVLPNCLRYSRCRTLPMQRLYIVIISQKVKGSTLGKIGL